MRLTTSGAGLYLATSQIALAHGILSRDGYLLRLRFVKDCAEGNTFEARAAMDILEAEEFRGDDDWPAGELKQPPPDEPAKESEVSISGGHGPYQPPVLHFAAAGKTGLHEWEFHQSDADFFPSIPHGHSRHDRRRKLDVYRGWIYREDRQDGREPRWKVIALWNDKKFRRFATLAINYYLGTYPKHRWPVQHPLKLPRPR